MGGFLGALAPALSFMAPVGETLGPIISRSANQQSQRQFAQNLLDQSGPEYSVFADALRNNPNLDPNYLIQSMGGPLGQATQEQYTTNQLQQIQKANPTWTPQQVLEQALIQGLPVGKEYSEVMAAGMKVPPLQYSDMQASLGQDLATYGHLMTPEMRAGIQAQMGPGATDAGIKAQFDADSEWKKLLTHQETRPIPTEVGGKAGTSLVPVSPAAGVSAGAPPAAAPAPPPAVSTIPPAPAPDSTGAIAPPAPGTPTAPLVSPGTAAAPPAPVAAVPAAPPNFYPKPLDPTQQREADTIEAVIPQLANVQQHIIDYGQKRWDQRSYLTREMSLLIAQHTGVLPGTDLSEDDAKKMAANDPVMADPNIGPARAKLELEHDPEFQKLKSLNLPLAELTSELVTVNAVSTAALLGAAGTKNYGFALHSHGHLPTATDNFYSVLTHIKTLTEPGGPYLSTLKVLGVPVPDSMPIPWDQLQARGIVPRDTAAAGAAPVWKWPRPAGVTSTPTWDSVHKAWSARNSKGETVYLGK
jgi:hypothetical protein